MRVDVLALCIATPVHTQARYWLCYLTGLLFAKEGCQLPLQTQCKELIENTELLLCFYVTSIQK